MPMVDKKNGTLSDRSADSSNLFVRIENRHWYCFDSENDINFRLILDRIFSWHDVPFTATTISQQQERPIQLGGVRLLSLGETPISLVHVLQRSYI
jgi:hypothetical protein